MAEHARPTNSMPATAIGTNREAFALREWGLLASIAAIWGSSFLFIDVGLEAFRPGVVTLARVTLGVVTLAAIPRSRAPIDREHLVRIALLGVIWIAIPMIIFPVAQQWIDSSVAGMLNAAMPIFSAAWATILLRAFPGWRQMVGIGIGFVGVMAISVPELTDSSASATGVGLVLLAVLLYGLSANLTVPLQQRYGSLPVLLRAQLAALVIVVPYGLLHLNGSTWAWKSALAMIPLGALGTGLAYALMGTLVGRVGAARGSIAIYFVPIVAMALGVTILDETLRPFAIIGTALVLVGAWIASRKES
ncbi:MAG: DMT family transporter [Armatimonadetes bacterium]|nr:MAG: DMT family transporter [Armatimonadota bacterium]